MKVSRFRQSVAAMTAALAVVAVALALTGGFDVRLAGVRIRAHSWVRPAIPALAGAVLLVWLGRVRVADLLTVAWRGVNTSVATRLLTLAAIVWTASASLAFSTVAAGGSDSYGYVSQARLLAEGRLTEPVPNGDWPVNDAARIPLGYVRGTAPGVMAPSYPPGLPLLMAPLTAFGERAVFVVVPAFGLLALWLVYRIGAGLGDPLAGGLGAILLSVSPVFLFQVFQPMSDVPAATCWLAGLLLSSRGSVRAATGAGAMVSLAILIRPNLAPLGALLLMAIVSSAPQSRWRRACALCGAAVPGVILLGWIQNTRYGSPWASGYPSLSDLFAFSNVSLNLDRYPRWVTETHTPLIWLSMLAPLWIHRRAESRGLAWAAYALCVAVWACYLLYTAFGPGEWSYTRFLLPALPLMLLFAATVWLWGVRRLPVPLRPLVTAAFLLILAFTLVRSAETHSVFAFHRIEQKYPMAGAFVRDRLPGSAVVVTVQHSGSVRYYAGRPTLRWDELQPARLDETLNALRARGLVPFAVIDVAEEGDFRRRFEGAGQRAVRRLSPLAVLGDARVYAFETP
jgi:dolichyl-phosphate-mannose-protein mannosyltransferase